MKRWSPEKPYNALPKLPPRVEVETKAVLKSCIEARAALAALKQATDLIPNATVLINTIPMLEAQASTEIENIVTTADALFRHADLGDSTADPATKEALRYRTALHEAFESLAKRPLSTGTAVRVCSIIKDADMQIRRVPGTGLGNPRTGKRVYTPPEGEARLRDLLANWEKFLHEQREIDPLVRMAIGHYQFEAIHPFTDGNGRTGRVLNLLFLVQEELLDVPVLYLSRYILRHKADYQRLLLEITTRQAWEPWLLFMLASVHDMASWTTRKIAAIRELERVTQEHVRKRAPKIYTRELVELIFTQPYCRIANLVEAGIAQRQSASEYLKALVGLGVLEEQKVGRDKLFLHPRFLRLLGNDDHTVHPYGKAR
jgi:Fic family protein